MREELEKVFNKFKICTEFDNKTEGARVSRYEFKLGKKQSIKSILRHELDIANALGVEHLRIIPIIKERGGVFGIELENETARAVKFGELSKSKKFLDHKSPLAFLIGEDITGNVVVGDIQTMPHLLIGGTTGSGKSVGINAMICSMIMRDPKGERVKFCMVDPKMTELDPYSQIPHLLGDVISSPKIADEMLADMCEEMNYRNRRMQKAGVRNIGEFNALGGELPYIVIIIDEMAQLMDNAKSIRNAITGAGGLDVENSIISLCQMARSAGIHLVTATQTPRATVITGRIKANIPSTIAYTVSSVLEAKIMGIKGADTLAGRGDMLYQPIGKSPERVQGCYISGEEVKEIVRRVADGKG